MDEPSGKAPTNIRSIRTVLVAASVSASQPYCGAKEGITTSQALGEERPVQKQMNKLKPVHIASRVRVGRFMPDGLQPHPNAGDVGRVCDLFNGKALLLVGRYYILVSTSCLERTRG